MDFYRPKRSFGQGNIFSSVCQEFCPQGGGCLLQIFGGVLQILGGCLLQIFWGGGACSKFSGGGCLLQIWGGCLLQIFGGVPAPNFGGVPAPNFRGVPDFRWFNDKDPVFTNTRINARPVRILRELAIQICFTNGCSHRARFSVMLPPDKSDFSPIMLLS